MISSAALLWGVLFGAVGMGFFVYGKKQGALVALLCGIALMALPWLVSSTLVLAILGLLLVALPFVLRN